MLGLKEVAQKEIEKEKEANKRITDRENIRKMFVEFVKDNLDEINEYFPVTKFFGNTFKVTQKDSLHYSYDYNYSICISWDDKIVVKCDSSSYSEIEIPYSLDDNKSVLYAKFKNALRALVSIGYKPNLVIK